MQWIGEICMSDEKKDSAVFFVNEEGELEQLTIWMDRDKAEKYIESKTYFPKKKQVVLQKVSKYWN